MTDCDANGKFRTPVGPLNVPPSKMKLLWGAIIQPKVFPRITDMTKLATIAIRNYGGEGTGWNDYGSVPAYETKWIEFFKNSAYDQFELQRGLNQAFSYDIVPTVPVLEAALRACRKLDDLGAAIRTFGALREKCKDDREYLEYKKYLQPIKEELGIPSPEEINRI